MSLIFIGCSHLYTGISPSVDIGKSGGCPTKSGIGLGIESFYYPKFTNGFGLGLDLKYLGYADCNDSDILGYLSPQIRYRNLILTDSQKYTNELYWFLSGGYAVGGFGEKGSIFGGGIHYNWKTIFMTLEPSYFSEFTQRDNLLKPGKSSNFSIQLTFGFHLSEKDK